MGAMLQHAPVMIICKYVDPSRPKMHVYTVYPSSVIVKGFCRVKKIQLSEKSSEVGGWVKPQLGFFLGGNFVFFVLYFVVVHV